MLDLTDGVQWHEVLQLMSQTFLVLIISLIHPWLNPVIPKRVLARMRANTFLTILFVFAIAYTYTLDIAHSIIVVVLFHYMKAALLRAYA